MRNILSQPDYKKRDGWGSYFTLIPSHITSILAVNKNLPSTLSCNLLIENCELQGLITVSEKSSNKYWYLWRLMILIIHLMPFLLSLTYSNREKYKNDRKRSMSSFRWKGCFKGSQHRYCWDPLSPVIIIGLFLSLLLYRPKAFPKLQGTTCFLKFVQNLYFNPEWIQKNSILKPWENQPFVRTAIFQFRQNLSCLFLWNRAVSPFLLKIENQNAGYHITMPISLSF